MAEEKQKFPLRLYGPEGEHIYEVETDEDMTLAANRNRPIEHGGKTYVWDQRTSRHLESGEPVKVRSGEKVEPAESEEPKAGGPTTRKG